MTRSDDPRPEPLEDLLLDGLLGELSPDEIQELDALLAGDATLRRRQAGLRALLAAERQVFEPEDAGVDATRVAAWVRHQAQGAEALKRASVRDRARAPRRRWARLLAFSVGAHVVLLGVVALLLRNDARVEPEPGAYIALEEGFGDYDPEPDAMDTELAKVYPSLTWDGPTQVPDELVLREQETYGESEGLPSALEPGSPFARSDVALFDQPLGVVVAASRRRNPALKRRRLDLLGFNANGTLRAVEKGLAFLAPRQNEDGSFPRTDRGANSGTNSGTAAATGGRDELEQTSIVLLAFLGDGHCSRAPAGSNSGSGHGPVVAKGVRWLRDELFEAASTDKERAARLAAHDVAVLGPATVALCEDYMLSYGWLSPAAAERRAREIAQLAARLQARSESAEENTAEKSAVEEPWAVWGLDAAARVGVVGTTAEDMKVFRQWVETAAGAKSTVTAMSFLSVGTALLYAERGAQKPRFLEWSRENAPRLVSRLGPHGYVRSGDTVGDTALVLLGLQVAYRTY